jgi:hypothetical protein
MSENVAEGSMARGARRLMSDTSHSRAVAFVRRSKSRHKARTGAPELVRSHEACTASRLWAHWAKRRLGPLFRRSKFDRHAVKVGQTLHRRQLAKLGNPRPNDWSGD